MNAKSDQASSSSVLKLIPELLESGGVGVLITIIDSNESVGTKLLVDEHGNKHGSLGALELDELALTRASSFLESREDIRAIRGKEIAPESSFAETLFLFERMQSEPRLVICGAGHVGAALAKLADFVGYRTTLIDDREEFLTRDRFQETNIELRLAQDWKEAVRAAVANGKGVAIAVVTRGHNEDEQCMRAAITTSLDYIGLIGSKRRTSIVINRLRESGASEEQLRSIRAPIGLDIGAVTPEEVALAIMAEIICERRGGEGGPLSAWRRRMSDTP
jgi:xanthine dehydrogenase accessory factor